MNTRTHAELAGFIWSICNLLRGPYKRNEYRKVILPMTVLRRFDSLLAPTKQAVLAAEERYRGRDESVRRGLLEQASGRPFYNTSKLTFATLLDAPNDLALNLLGYIKGFSPNVREIMERFAFDQQVARMDEKNLLFEVIKKFAAIDLSPERVDNVQMGYVFEELIRVGAEQSNEEAGEHFTPREVIRLMVSLLLSPEPDLGKGHVVKTIFDPACGTGGMLSVAEEYLREHNSQSNPQLFGQDINDEAWAICRSDMLIKGEDANNIVRGDSFTEDGFDRWPDGRKRTFDYMLANPPFGVEWKQQQRKVEQERDTLGYEGRFGAGLPRINDGSLLFLQHMLSKRQAVSDGGSRLAIVFNGSPLFTGDAGSGESNIRQWIIENDWLEAIVALPDQLFYNTGISTYVWVLTNRKEPRRKGKVQLIDGRQFFVKMRKSLGNKRNKIGDPHDDPREPDHIGELVRIYGTFQDGEAREFTDEDPVTHQPRTRQRVVSKVFDNDDFGFHKITVERPLRLNFAATEERIARIEDDTTFRGLATSKKKAGKAHDQEVTEGLERQQDVRGLLTVLALVTGRPVEALEPPGITGARVTLVSAADETPEIMTLAPTALRIEPQIAAKGPFLITRLGTWTYGRDDEGVTWWTRSHETIEADIACFRDESCPRGKPEDDWWEDETPAGGIAQLREAARMASDGTFRSRDDFLAVLDAAEAVTGVRLSALERKAVLNALSDRNTDADVCLDRHGDPEPDPDLRDTESVPLKEVVETYFAREVLPHVPDAWIDEGKTKVGFEIPLNRHFYVYEPPRPLEEIEADLQMLEREIASLLAEVTAR